MSVARPELIGSICNTGATLGQESGFGGSHVPEG